MKNIGKILWGVVLVVIGVILGTNALELTHIDIFFAGWWTLFIIVPCFIGLFTDNEKTGNVIGIIIGVCLFLACNDLIDFDIIWKLFIPVVLVIIGLSIIFKDVINSKFKKEMDKINNSNSQKICATFSSEKRKLEAEEFKGVSLTSIFGAIEYDLTDAKIKEDQIIDVYTTFGGIELTLPDDVNVVVTTTSIFGGVSSKKTNKKKESAKTIYIKGTCIFGGVEVK